MRGKLIFLDYDKGIRVKYNINKLDDIIIRDIVDHVGRMFEYSREHGSEHEATYAGLTFNSPTEVDKFLYSLKDLEKLKEDVIETLRRC